MAISLSAPRTTELKPRIVVFGIGGAGGNAVNNMIEAGLEGVEFVVANTDAQQLQFAKTDRRIQLGVTVTQGLGAGAHPEVGMSAAEESIPASAERMRRVPSNRNGLVTTPTVRMPLLRATSAMTGAAPVPVPPPMPAARNTMLHPSSARPISATVSSAAARPSTTCRG